MSLAEDSAGLLQRSSISPLDPSRVATIRRLPVYLACAAFALIVNYLLGKEMAWDTLSYHLYSGFSAVRDRFAQDYFAAGPQSYFNPYAYVPFYVLATSGLSALQASSVLALLHAVILCLTFELALRVFPAGDRLHRLGFAVCTVALAGVNPVLLQQIGTSFADITTGELILAGWLLLATTVRAPSAARVMFAAALIGSASALKPTNTVHAVAAVAILIMLPGPVRERIRYLAAYVVTLGAAFGIVAAPWSYRLERTFGNPFFPLLNNLYRSPEFVTEPLRHYRFIPSSLAEGLWRPFAMLNPESMVHEELIAPDPRYAALFVVAGVLLAQWLWRGRRTAGATAVVQSSVDARLLAALGCAFSVDWVLWLMASGNSRYFLPIACVASVLLAGTLSLVFAARARARTCLLAAIFITQILQLSIGAELRWNGVPWDGGPWFEVRVPEKLMTAPALYLSLDVRSNSFVAPYVAPKSSFINFGGSYPLGLAGANGARVAALIRQHAPYVRFLTLGARLYADAERRMPSVSEVNGAVQRLGLRADPADCATITVYGLPPLPEVRFASRLPGGNRAADAAEDELKDTSYLVSCGLVPDYTDRSSALALEQRAADLVLDRLEDACPELFQPRRPPTDNRSNIWRRFYLNSDLFAWVSNAEVKFLDPMRGDNMVHLGRESDWLRAPQTLICGRHSGHYYARVVGPGAAAP